MSSAGRQARMAGQSARGSVDEWRGRRKVKAMLQSIEPLALCPAMRACLPGDRR